MRPVIQRALIGSCIASCFAVYQWVSHEGGVPNIIGWDRTPIHQMEPQERRAPLVKRISVDRTWRSVDRHDGCLPDYSGIDILIAPHYKPGRVLPLLDVQGRRFQHHRYGASIGLIGRYPTSDLRAIFGLNAFYDYRQGHYAGYHRAGAGLEWLHRRWDVRANGYFPMRKETGHHCRFNYPGGYTFSYRRTETLFSGWDAEVGWLAVRGKEFRLYAGAGPYGFDGCCSSGHRCGWSVRVRPQWRDIIALDVRVSHDSWFKTIVHTKLSLTAPLYELKSNKGNHAHKLTDRDVYQPVIRSEGLPMCRRSCWRANFETQPQCGG